MQQLCKAFQVLVYLLFQTTGVAFLSIRFFILDLGKVRTYLLFQTWVVFWVSGSLF